MLERKINFSISPVVFLFLLSGIFTLQAQMIIKDPNQGSFSLRPHAELLINPAEANNFQHILENENDLPFKPLNDFEENYGFSEDHFWIRFQLENQTDQNLQYYLETGRPITDEVTLFVRNASNQTTIQYNGDAIPFETKSVLHRKSIFQIDLKPKEQILAFVHLKGDGEVMMFPLQLITQKEFLYKSYKEQLFYGFFYGILILACVIYLFFYSALRDKAFIYYGLYVLFIATLEFSLDGLFHQYITPNGGWLSNRAVLFSALTSLFFFGKYGQNFLSVFSHSKILDISFRVMSGIILACLIGLCLVPNFISYCYPIANIIGLVVLLQIVISIFFLKRKKVPVDHFFIIGISFLVLGFSVFILNNLNAVPNSFFTENGAKFGIGLEIIFLSISMGNRIKTLRLENENNQLLALQRAEDMNDIKTSFISNISHELRTPLNLIMGVAASLKENKREEEIEENCELILNSSENLLSQIEDILDFTIIEKGDQNLKPAPFNIDWTLRKIAETNSFKAENKNLEFSYSLEKGLPEKLIGDKRKLVQILNNLLDNAIKFTESGKIALHVGHVTNKNNVTSLCFTISDTGIGISKEKMSTIYECFTKKSFLDKREYYGLGLGLFIVKNYIDLQNGHISIKNNGPQGTVCTVHLDFQLDEDFILRNASENNKKQELDLGGCNVLLVEDNKMNQKVISLLIKKCKNTNLMIANNGQEALDMIKSNTFDVVLMDLQMPVMDGFEATAMIRSGKAGNNSSEIPIIVITADITEKTRKEIFRLGADDYMTKPINGNLLFTKMMKHAIVPIRS